MDSALLLLLQKPQNYSQRTIKLLSPAKINLYFNIVGRYPDGFSRVETVMERVSLCDEITISVEESKKVVISSSRRNLSGRNNIIFKVVNFLKKKFKIPYGFHIYLKKNIPLGAGLGGGSSNAALTLLGINELCDLGLTRDEMYKIGSKIGSDVNFFISQENFAFARGKGDKVIPIKGRKLSHFILWPGFSLSTREVYKNITAKLTKFRNNVNIIKYALGKGEIELLKSCSINYLERKVLSLKPELFKVKKALSKKKIFTKLTGSGSCLYTIGEGISYRKIKEILPQNWEFFSVRTF